jgi:hypothetical protein
VHPEHAAAFDAQFDRVRAQARDALGALWCRPYAVAHTTSDVVGIGSMVVDRMHRAPRAIARAEKGAAARRRRRRRADADRRRRC